MVFEGHEEERRKQEMVLILKFEKGLFSPI